MLEEKIVIGSNDINANLELKLAALFRIMQDVIMHDTNNHGIGASDLRKMNILWVITRASMHIRRMPKFEEEVNCVTYPGQDLKMFYPRYFRMLDKDGNLLINFSSVWAIIDAETRKPILKCPFQEKLYESHLKDELDLPQKVVIREGFEVEKRKIHYSDVDLNNHLNNTRYIELISDIHDSNFHTNHPIEFINLNYIKEIKENSIVTIFTNKENPEYIAVKSNDQLSFVAEIKYRD